MAPAHFSVVPSSAMIAPLRQIVFNSFLSQEANDRIDEARLASVCTIVMQLLQNLGIANLVRCKSFSHKPEGGSQIFYVFQAWQLLDSVYI